MSFRRFIAALAPVTIFISGVGAADREVARQITVGGVALPRPVLIRSDFASEDVVRDFFVRSHFSSPKSVCDFVSSHPLECRKYFHNDYIRECIAYRRQPKGDIPLPMLKNGSRIEVGLGFDSAGGSVFPRRAIIESITPQWWENQYVGDGYRAACNHEMALRVAKNPAAFQGRISNETIDQYCRYVRNGCKGSLNNPVLASGERGQWHHDVGKKRFLLLSETDHKGVNTLPSKGHGSGTNLAGGGNKTWGRKPARSAVLTTTSKRWLSFVGLDILLSTSSMYLSGERRKEAYLVNAGAAVAAGAGAVIAESLIVSAFPLSQGVTQSYLSGLALGAGGPASWVGTLVYLLTRQAIMIGWRSHEMAQARRVERACVLSERNARLAILLCRLKDNSIRLQQIIHGAKQ